MRIVGGKYRGRRLTAPQGHDTRPTSDRTRESLFNILMHAPFAPELEGAVVLDGFCGTGALGLEALSRGAARACFMDLSDTALGIARKNAATLGAVKDCLFLRFDLTRPAPPPRAAGAPVDIVFLDAPYQQGLSEPAAAGLIARNWIKPDGVFVIEVAADEALPPPRGWAVVDERSYGAAKVLFLKAQPSGTPT